MPGPVRDAVRGWPGTGRKLNLSIKPWDWNLIFIIKNVKLIGYIILKRGIYNGLEIL